MSRSRSIRTPGSRSTHGSAVARPLDAFLATARMNLAFFEGLSAAQRATTLSHPEYGELTVDWIIHQMAGHHINHLLQLERIAGE